MTAANGQLREVLDEVAGGRVTTDTALGRLAALPFADLGYARTDHHRPLRTSEPEVVFAQGKTPAQVAGIVADLLAHGSAPVLATRASPEHAAAVSQATYDPTSGLLVARRHDPVPDAGTTVVVCAGTSDLPVAAEAVGTLEAFGLPTDLVVDVGVAGVHRVLSERQRLADADVCVVVAGMEGALPSLVAGLISAPVVAIPTSVGYGASFQGLAALLGMLTSCAPGISVVNIDNGFGAAVVARRILNTGRD